MANKDEIFSLRLVIADFYLEKPTHGLDPCYSEFRGKEIKKVPIIRIFGANSHGQKCCMHVHGVFPYLYIPYDKRDFENLNKAIYQIATSLDKAINVSLGQTSATAQHVFKIQLVKGIPFYGYHRNEHQFLKIYMLNPRFVRRAANLLQNGAIMNKNFHPHESHVPYILQFMIDFNLYGMSFLHVPFEVVKFRRKDDADEIHFTGVQQAQILHTNVVKKQTCSAVEVDIGSNFILNRFQLKSKNNVTQTNPGIEAIWLDERIRRQKLAVNITETDHQIPALEIPPTQERPNVQPTESEIFYRTALLSKLLAMETSMLTNSGNLADQTLNATLQSNVPNATMNVDTNLSNKEKRRTFNLKKLLANAVYPEECTQADQLTNASFIENHLSNNSMFQSFINEHLENNVVTDADADADDSAFLNDTIVDEQLVLSLTQSNVALNTSLRQQDMELLDVLQQLEEDNENHNQIDLDSTLAPLSQQHKNFDLSPNLLDKETAAAATKQPISDSDTESENDDGEHIHDFSIALDDIDELLSKLTQTQPSQPKSNAPELPQTDGADDYLSTPTKPQQKHVARQQTTPPRTPKTRAQSCHGTPKRSPQTPKRNAAAKYAPLPLLITKRTSSVKKIDEDKTATTPHKETCLSLEVNEHAKSTMVPLRKRLALTEMRRKSMSVVDELHEMKTVVANIPQSSNTKPRRVRKSAADLEKTHITCALTPRRKSERVLKVYNAEKQTEIPVIQNATSQLNEKGKKLKLKGDDKKVPNKELKNATRKSTRLQKKIDGVDVSEKDIQNVCEIETVKAQQVPEHAVIVKSKVELAKRSSNTLKICKESTQIYTKTNDTLIDNKNVEETNVDDEEEISASDTEAEHSLRKTPNLKRLRRSFYAASLRKRKKNDNYSSVQEIICNSSKFETNETQILNAKLQTPNSSSLNKIVSTEFESEKDAKLKSNQRLSYSVISPALFSEVSSPLLASSFSMSPLVLSSSGSVKPSAPSPTIPTSASHSSGTISSGIEPTFVITPLDLPPTYSEVLSKCPKLDIFEFDFPKPYYSNPDDITKNKEVGHTVLHIPGNKLNDCCEFESVLGTDLKGLANWRRKKIVDIGGAAMLNRYRNAQQIREYLASQKQVVIAPAQSAPSQYDAKLWLKAREFLKAKNGQDIAEAKEIIEEDSPIKVRRQKITMMLADEDGTSVNHEDLDCSTRSLTLTPMTPGSAIKPFGESKVLSNPNATPLTTIQIDEQSTNAKSCKATRRRRSMRAHISLNEKLKAAVEEKNEDNLANNELKTRQSSETSENSISSQQVLAALERSSFVKNVQSTSSGQHDVSFGLTSATLNNTFGFKVNLENLQEAKSDIEYNYLTTITLEVFAPTRDDLYPNPEIDEIRCMFYAIENSIPTESCSDQLQLPTKACGYIIVNDCSDIIAKESKIHGIDADIELKVVNTEMEAMQALLALCAMWDPDIYAGYEIEMASWGYIMERAKYLCINIGPLLSRVPTQKVHDFVDEERDQYTDLDIETKLCGRILLDVWRLMRSEIALTSYTFENVMYHILHKRCPWHSYRDLTTWFASPCSRWIVIEYYLERVRGTLLLLDQLDLIGRTSEMAKLIGIQFYEVLSRGSQFRVESMMLRIAKPKNLVPLSPSVQQRAHMRAPEYLALILEPQSRFYADPVIVLDFQSLYPSMIIAYNYCFSTCLGRVEHLGQSVPFEFGASQLRVSPQMLQKLMERDLITISPCGVVFVKSSVREGILPRMLTEILDTRQMVKQSMKLHKSNSVLQRILHSRQLGLKLMANVTYGYTAANFSGRMPAVEVGDSVVAKGRETLERAIKLVEANEDWKVRVVYGDTDSLFVKVPGRNRAAAFKIGAEIAEAVTKVNPHPVKLKLEKVYQPCILQTKKRYVGYMYESADQAEPVYEAKGIETVRRDGCPASAKMLEKVLRILFETADVSQVKQYVCRQFTKLLSGRANLQDLIFAKEFRGLNGYKPTACVPALEMTRKWIQTDPRHIPRRGERVPFIITNGPPGVPLIRLVRHPHEVLANEGLKINAIYYITKAIIPPLNRCLLLIGADVNEWFTNLPRKVFLTPALSTANELIAHTNAGNQLKKSTISQYFSTTNCIIDCGRQTKQGICAVCESNALKTFVTLQTKIAKIERGFQLTQHICQACCGRVGDLNCGSLDCPVLYVLEVKRRELQQIAHIRHLLEERF